MKIAVLISGEYRTFEFCRPTMTFLDDPRVDVFFSTWNKSVAKNSVLGVDQILNVDSELILNHLRRPATITIDEDSSFTSIKYNSRMINRWLRGFESIKISNIKYDYVLVIRPDLFFNKNEYMFTVDMLIEDGLEQFAWYSQYSKLQDNMFFGSFEKISSIFENLKILDWQNDAEQDWHTWWTKFIKWKNIKRLGRNVSFTFCRPQIKTHSTFPQVFEAYEDWRDVEIARQVKMGNYSIVARDWGTEIVETAHSKFNKPRVAIFVCGMIRQMDVCIESWGKLRDINADWYLSTWDKSHEAHSSVWFFIPPIPNKESFKQIIVSNYDDVKFNSVRKRNGENSKRFLYLLDKFSNEMSSYDRIILIRPDTFLNSNSIFDTETLMSKEVISNICTDDFIQDFLLMLPPEYFQRISQLKEIAESGLDFNPHVCLIEYCRKAGIGMRACSNIDATLARPLSRNKNNPTVVEVDNDRLLWDSYHSSPLGKSFDVDY